MLWSTIVTRFVELRDLKFVSRMTHLMKESDPDLLSTEVHFIFNKKLTNGRTNCETEILVGYGLTYWLSLLGHWRSVSNLVAGRAPA